MTLDVQPKVFVEKPVNDASKQDNKEVTDHRGERDAKSSRVVAFVFPDFDRILTVEESAFCTVAVGAVPFRASAIRSTRMAQAPAGVLSHDLLSVAPSDPSHTVHLVHPSHRYDRAL